jgi:hypothetical protein
MKYQSPIRHSIEISLKPAARPDGPVLSISKPESRPEFTTEKKRTFVEDFNMEHSCSNVTVALKAFSTGTDAGEQSRSRNPTALSMNTPSCVYLG